MKVGDLDSEEGGSRKKVYLVDLAPLGFRPDKCEGLAIVNPTTPAVANDNDFGIESIDSNGRVTRSQAGRRLVVIRLPEPVR